MTQKELLCAMETVINQNGGEFHGDFATVTQLLAHELEGVSPIGLDIFLRHIGLQAMTAGSNVVFMVDMSGELNFVDRKLMAEVNNHE